MNYLAHAYLSFKNNEILLGNMISDFVKGKHQYDYPDVVHKGIVLHRYIDAFTDTHPATQKAKAVFKTDYRLYSGAFVDVAYDHFLANDSNEFLDDGLLQFSLNTYKGLSLQENLMPEKFKKMFYYMQLQNWLCNYKTREGLYQSFGGLVKRAAYLHNSLSAINSFDNNYDFLRDCYLIFWKDLKLFATEKCKKLLSS